MANHISIYTFFFLMILLTSCGKESMQTIHEDVIIEDNTPPYYDEVPTIQIETFIIKLHIDLIGREPSDAEKADALALLKAGDLSEASRISLAESLFNSLEYYKRFDDLLRARMLNALNRIEVEEEIDYVEETIAYYDTIPGFEFEVALAQFELQDLQGLLSARDEYQASQISINEYYGRMVSNLFYDEINMGAENFVLSVFENFFKRLPTVDELDRGINMVNGNQAVLFGENSASKGGFINVCINTEEFYEGLAFEAYQSLILRNPNTLEAGETLQELVGGATYDDIQKRLVISKEYAGF